MDGDRSSPRIRPSPQPTSATEQEARRLQEAITSITNEGTTEARLRQLIAECKTFLSGQPRQLVGISFRIPADLGIERKPIAVFGLSGKLQDARLPLRSQEHLTHAGSVG